MLKSILKTTELINLYNFIDNDHLVSYDKKLTLWKNGVCIKAVDDDILKRSGYIVDAIYCFNKYVAVYAKHDLYINIYDTKLNLLCKLEFNSSIRAAAWSLCGKLAVGLHYNEIELWEMKDHKFCRTKTETHTNRDDSIRYIAWSPIGLLAVQSEYKISIWNNELKRIKIYGDMIMMYELVWISDTSFLFSIDTNLSAVRDINISGQVWYTDKIKLMGNVIPITSEIILYVLYDDISLIIKDLYTTDKGSSSVVKIGIFPIKIHNTIRSTKGNIVVKAIHELFTCDIPEISLLKLIPVGLMTKNTSWSNFLKNEPYDPRLFLFIAALACNKK